VSHPVHLEADRQILRRQIEARRISTSNPDTKTVDRLDRLGFVEWHPAGERDEHGHLLMPFAIHWPSVFDALGVVRGVGA